MVTTPIDPVNSSDPKRPPPRFLSSRLSSWRRQHIDLTSPGLSSAWMRFWKYGVPYLAVISKRSLACGVLQSTFDVILYVGIGYWNPLPFASPASISSMKTWLMMSISFWQSPYVKSTSSPPIRARNAVERRRDLENPSLLILVKALAAHSSRDEGRGDPPYDHGGAGTQAAGQGNFRVDGKLDFGNPYAQKPRGVTKSLEEQIIRPGELFLAAQYFGSVGLIYFEAIV